MNTLSTKALEQALASLNQSITVTKQLLQDKNTTTAHKQILQAGVIQNFEFCFELSWKTLKRKLEQETSDAALIGTMLYQELIREGAQKGFIVNAEKWFEYRRDRNLTSHTYHAENAEKVYRTAIEFYPDALDLLHKLKEKEK